MCKIKKDEVIKMDHQFTCVVFLADGKHISQTEVCATASEAMDRAAKWRAVGHIAQAYIEVDDLDKLERYHFPLN
jgi:hypothetical protein